MKFRAIYFTDGLQNLCLLPLLLNKRKRSKLSKIFYSYSGRYFLNLDKKGSIHVAKFLFAEKTDIENLTEDGFRCFKSYFLWNNENLQNILRVNGAPPNATQVDFEFLVLSDKLQGVEILWRIAFDNKNADVRELAKNLLVNLHVRLHQKVQKQTSVIVERFIDLCFEQIKREENEQTALTGFAILTTFIELFSFFI
jgi:hypothetical protein